jgi:DNA repair protein RadC
MTARTTDLQEALLLLQSRPEIAADVLVMAGVRHSSTYVKSAKADVERVMRERMLGSEQEMFMILAVDMAGELIDSEVLFRGFEGSVLTSPKIIFRWLLTRQRSVHTFYMAHNHPTGASRPSGPDIDMTESLLRLSTLIGMVMMDHLILGAGGDITSVRETVASNIRNFGYPKGNLGMTGADDVIRRMFGAMKGALGQFDVASEKLWDVE